MRRDHEASLAPDRVIRLRRLFGQDVERGTRQRSLRQRGQQCVLVDRLRSTDVDEDRACSQSSELGSSDDPACLGRERKCEHEDLRLGQPCAPRVGRVHDEALRILRALVEPAARAFDLDAEAP